jgi:NADH-quinone oxidoreductase subunit L
MAGDQSLDRMGGFRKAMPFTFIGFMVGGLALSGLPPFSGWLSKDEILGFLDHRGGGFLVLGILGYIGAFLTALYTFRMIFRAFFGEPVEQARELEAGHLAHADVPRNPATGEEEDTDVGFPGPDHHIAERDPPMKIAMGALATLAVVGGALQIPGVDDGIVRFLSTAFADSKLSRALPSTGTDWVGLAIGAAIAVVGIAVAYRLWIAAPEAPSKIRARFAPLYTLFVNKWYFDELIDVLVVRPALMIGRLFDSAGERIVVARGLTGGTVAIVRASSAAVRRAQTGLLRYYAAGMVIFISAVALYFLVSST